MAALLANILTVMAYTAVVMFFGANAYEKNQSLDEAFLVGAQVLCGLVAALALLDLWLHAIHSPEGPVQVWLSRRRAAD